MVVSKIFLFLFENAGLNEYLPVTIGDNESQVEVAKTMGETLDLNGNIQDAVTFKYSSSFGDALSLNTISATNKQMNDQAAFMINYETFKNNTVVNFNNYFSSVKNSSIGIASGFKYGISTDPKNPTNVNLLGGSSQISFSYGLKSDGRFVIPGEWNQLHNNRSKIEYFHPNSYDFGGVNSPIFTIYFNH